MLGRTSYGSSAWCFALGARVALICPMLVPGQVFGNAGCKFDDAGDVPMTSVERDNVAVIKRVEQRKDCTE